RNPARRIEIPDFAGDTRRKRGSIEIGEWADSAATRGDVAPGGGQIIADRADDAHAGNDDATLAHVRDSVLRGTPSSTYAGVAFPVPKMKAAPRGRSLLDRVMRRNGFRSVLRDGNRSSATRAARTLPRHGIRI